MWIMAISQNYGIQVEGNCLNFKQGPPTPWQCYCTGCIPAQTWDLVDYSLLSEAQTSGIKQRSGVGNVVEEIVVDGLCIYVCLCVAWTISLCVSDSLSAFLQSYPSTEGLQSRQWVGVTAKESGKLPLALSQHGDFPLLQPHVSVWLFPNKT